MMNEGEENGAINGTGGVSSGGCLDQDDGASGELAIDGDDSDSVSSTSPSLQRRRFLLPQVSSSFSSSSSSSSSTSSTSASRYTFVPIQLPSSQNQQSNYLMNKV